jgi:hypothetical protein
LYSGIVNQDIESTKTRYRSGYHLSHVGGDSDVTFDGKRLSTYSSDFGHRRLRRVRRGLVIDGYTATCARQFKGDSFSNPATCTRDESRPSFQLVLFRIHAVLPNLRRPHI